MNSPSSAALPASSGSGSSPARIRRDLNVLAAASAMACALIRKGAGEGCSAAPLPRFPSPLCWCPPPAW